MGKKLTFEEFSVRINKIFNNTLDLTNFNFVNTSTKGQCRCKICGYEWEVKGNTLLNGHGCRKCYNKRNSKKRIIPLEEIQEQINQYRTNVVIIGDYIDTKHKCLCRCNNCGYEWMTKTAYLKRGHGCPKCNTRWTNNRVSKDEFIKNMDYLYNSEYQYVINQDYITTRDFIKFICPIHGEVEQLVYTHIQGNGCKFCRESGLEKQVRMGLLKSNINIIPQYKFKWLGKQSLDFYLPDYNIAIECQGGQHFEVVECFGGDKEFKKVRERDSRKKQLCKENNVQLIYYLDKQFEKYMKDDDLYFTDKNSLIEYIKNLTK